MPDDSMRLRFQQENYHNRFTTSFPNLGNGYTINCVENLVGSLPYFDYIYI